jgi:hypothetical protein
MLSDTRRVASYFFSLEKKKRSFNTENAGHVHCSYIHHEHINHEEKNKEFRNILQYSILFLSFSKNMKNMVGTALLCIRTPQMLILFSCIYTLHNC